MFKVGDWVWFLHTEYGRNCWYEDETIVYPGELEITTGKIVAINEEKDSIDIYVPGHKTILSISYLIHQSIIFDSKQLAIDHMHEALANLQG